MLKNHQIIGLLNQFAPLSYQESYDNAGLIVGDASQETKGVLVSLDCTEKVVEEAIEKNCNLIVAHHPIVFRGLKSFTGRSYVERTVIKAIKNDIAIYATHTNLDNVKGGVSYHIASRLGLQNVSTLLPKKGILKKLTTFCPQKHTDSLLEALYSVGAGKIGNYQKCSFKLEGTGSFEPDAAANPHIGERGKYEEVKEHRIEVMFPAHLESAIVSQLKANHPYEEVAYYIHLLENENQEVGSGVIGTLAEAMLAKDFLYYLKEKMELKCFKYTPLVKQHIQKVALCGGSGFFLLGQAIRQQADIYITADVKYHEFFDAEDKIILADIGHYESEVFTKDLIASILSQNFTNIAIHLSNINTNPVNYLM